MDYTCGWYSTYHSCHLLLPFVDQSDQDMFTVCGDHHRDGGVLPGVSTLVVDGLLVPDGGQDKLVVDSWAHTCLILIKVKISDRQLQTMNIHLHLPN